MSAAVGERAAPHVPCEQCADQTPALWRYVGGVMSARNLCDFHRALFQANVDARPGQYHKLADS